MTTNQLDYSMHLPNALFMFDPEVLEGESIFNEILGEIVSRVSPEDCDVLDHPELKTAERHGLGYLTGNAEAQLDLAHTADTRAEWEEHMMESICFSILAIISARASDAAMLDSDDGPSGDTGGISIYPPIDMTPHEKANAAYFNLLASLPTLSRPPISLGYSGN